MHGRILVHTSLLLFITTPVRACPCTGSGALCVVALGAVHAICVHTCRQVLSLVLHQVSGQVSHKATMHVCPRV